jgi:ABC-type branched-subunit amino acid transport system substrate-binding protein
MEIAREADHWRIPIILITAKEGVTISNQYVFQHFLTPSQQIGALTRYALDNLNCAIFSILYPKDDYGIEMLKTIREQVPGIGGKVERAIPYSKTQTDFSEEINRITGNRIDTAKKIAANKMETKARVSVDFEALFIPDSYQRVRMITSQLAFYDVKGFRLLGTSLWNSPDLLKKGAEYLEGAVFADSFFVNSFYPETNDFVDIYYTVYGREPENIEALAYDTARMIINVLENKNIQTREQFIAGLQKLENYRGATGNTSFSGGRVATKTAFILQVKSGKLEQVK